MAQDVIVIGGGIVGVSTAIHLLRRGRSVLLVDKNTPGRETSFGNAGIIQREGVGKVRCRRSEGGLLTRWRCVRVALTSRQLQ